VLKINIPNALHMERHYTISMILSLAVFRWIA